MKIECGTVFNQYEILAAIGKGGMGEVFLAQDKKLNRKVALKILPSEFAEDNDRMTRFVREAQSASALNHPNIITIHEIGECEGTHFIATEFIDGKTLSDYAKSNSLSYKSALEIAIQVASALDVAHCAGIVHRDIKPDNVMIRPDGFVKILDFGIAKLSEATKYIGEEDATAIQQPSTSLGMIIGTANYMSPEQAKGEVVDVRSDIFSLGVMLYEMLSSELPFEGKSAMEIISSILKDNPKPLGDDVPNEIRNIINKTLRKDRNERYQTIRDVLNDLKDVNQNLELQNLMERTILPDKEGPKTQIIKATTVDESDQTTTNVNRNDSITIKKSGFRKATVGVFAVLLIAAIGLGYLFYSGSNSKQIESIAVMPFVNESGNQEIEYLSDGMTETLIKSLSTLPNLSVKARSSVFRYKGKDTDAKTIGQELNVQAVLNGRVMQRGDGLTLNLELIDAQTENVIWTETDNRKQSELVSLQSEIARDVSSKLTAKLSGADELKVTKSYTANAEAYENYLKGRFYWNKRTKESFDKAIQEFQQAVEKDPNYALAYSGLADTYVLLEEYADTPASESLPKARAYAERALAIDENLSEAYVSLGLIKTYSWEWTAAERDFKRAIELSPNYPTAHHWYQLMLRYVGRYDEAMAEIKRAQTLDPLSNIISANIVNTSLARGDIDTAIAQSRKIIELDSESWFGYFYLGTSYLAQNRSAEAIPDLEKAVRLTTRSNQTVSSLGEAFAAAGKRSEAMANLKELEEKFSRRETSGTNLARIYVALRDKDAAFASLEKDFQSRSSVLPLIAYQPSFKPLRGDPRFKDLLKRMNLPE